MHETNAGEVTERPAKRVLLVVSGAFEAPAPATPLADAEKPALDEMVRKGRVGVVVLSARTPWDGFTALLGLGDRAPSLGAAEALGSDFAVEAGESVYRADFVTLDDRGVADPFGGKVKDPEAASLVATAMAAAPSVRFARLGGHRNLVAMAGPAQPTASPWEVVGQDTRAWLPAEGPVRDFHDATSRALAADDVNAVRIDLSENPANALWLHGGGAPASAGSAAGVLPPQTILVGRGAATLGLARSMGCLATVVDGDDDALAAAALAAIARADTVVVRTESVLDAAALGGPEAKRDAISATAARLIATVYAAVQETDSFLLAVTSDCVYDAASRAMIRRAVPIVVVGAGTAGLDDPFTEEVCEKGGWHLASGSEVAALLA